MSCCCASWSSWPGASKMYTAGISGCLQERSGHSSMTSCGCSAGALEHTHGSSCMWQQVLQTSSIAACCAYHLAGACLAAYQVRLSSSCGWRMQTLPGRVTSAWRSAQSAQRCKPHLVRRPAHVPYIRACVLCCAWCCVCCCTDTRQRSCSWMAGCSGTPAVLRNCLSSRVMVGSGG
jgi:hypothetical protein